MKIPLKIIEGLIFVNAVLITPKYHIGLGQVEFLVDTGSSETFISEGTAVKLNIPISKLPFEKHVKMAGSTLELLKMSDITLFFKNDENKSEKIELPFIHVMQATKKDIQSRTAAQSYPSILGTDFLTKNKFSLIFTPHKNIAYLERE